MYLRLRLQVSVYGGGLWCGVLWYMRTESGNFIPAGWRDLDLGRARSRWSHESMHLPRSEQALI